MNNIDYEKLFKALRVYGSIGYEYTHLDWVVKEEISNITKPQSCKNFFIDDNVLVASAEQSFLQMSFNGKLKKGKYSGITPCFRDEAVDDTHNTYFMKVELFDTINVTQESLNNMLFDSKNFFNAYINCKIIETAEGYDIVDSVNNIELGSYGIREYNGLKWVYGTGCAEPRLTKAIEMAKLKGNSF